ncbi:MAG: FtsQ-type POTRA domain-containing protein [Clostridia bacterium]|nr:FtsQ-type POTRA domain-containing protein [Clostridia bacterium]
MKENDYTTGRRLTPNQTKRIEQTAQRSRRRHRSRAVLAVLGVLAAAAVCFTVCFFVFQVEFIVIDGNTHDTDSDIELAGELEVGRSMFSYLLFHNEKLIERLPYVKSARISRELPESLVVEITEEVPEAFCRMKGSVYALLSQDNVVLEKSAQAFSGCAYIRGLELPEIEIGENAEVFVSSEIDSLAEKAGKTSGEQAKAELETEKNVLSGTLRLLRLKDKLMSLCRDRDIHGVTEADFTENSQIRIELDDRITLILGSENDLDHNLKLAKSAVANEKSSRPGENVVIDFTYDGIAVARNSDVVPMTLPPYEESTEAEIIEAESEILKNNG